MEYTNYVVCHKDFDWNFGDYVNSQYQAIGTKDVKTNLNYTKIETDLPDEIYGEITYMKWIADNCKTDWFSLSHYRRKFDFVYGIPSYVEMRFGCSVADQTVYYHSKQIFEMFIGYLFRTNEQIAKAFIETVKMNVFCPYNIMAGPVEMARDWVNVVANPVIDFMQNELKIKTIEDAYNFVKTTDSLVPRENKNIEIKYQARIGGFLAERMNTMFWLSLFQNPKLACNVNLLEAGQRI